VDISPEQESYEPGTEVTLIADPDEHWYFDEWTGNSSGSGGQTTITIDEDKSITAKFEKHEYDLDMTVEGDGSVDISPEQESYEPGTEVTLTADPDEHWYFDEWTGDTSGNDEKTTIIMDDDRSVTAWFEEHEYDLDLIVEGNGSVNIEPEKEGYEPEEKVDLTAISEENWYFERWAEDASSTEEQITIIMNEDKNITCVFEEHSYNLTVNVEGEGSIDVDPDEKEYEPGTIVNLTAEPDEQYYFERWSGDHESEDKEINITLDDNKEISAHFKKGEAIFYIEIIGQDEKVEIGDQVTVEYLVENTGEVEGTQEMVFRVNNRDIEVVEFSLSPGENKTENFSMEAEKDIFEEEGEFDLQVLGEDEGDSVTVVVEESSLVSDGKNFLFDYWWVLLIITGSIGVIGFTQVTSKDLDDSNNKGPLLEVGPPEEPNRTKNKGKRNQNGNKSMMSIISSEKSNRGSSPGKKTTPRPKDSTKGGPILSDLGKQDYMNNKSVVESLFKSMKRATERQSYEVLVREKGEVMDEQEFKDAIQELVKKERLTVQPRRDSEDLYIWKG
ncbi:MAG: InlB B-repeat-containing protein, partial [Candidatus Natronoplasma sp.]